MFAGLRMCLLGLVLILIWRCLGRLRLVCRSACLLVR